MMVLKRGLPKILLVVLLSKATVGLVPPNPCLSEKTASTLSAKNLLHPAVLSATTHKRLARTRLYELEDQKKGLLEMILDPVPTKIPKEMREEINVAEGNTIAGKERTQRITLYVVLALVLVGIAVFNAFLTELRDTVDPETISKFNELVPVDEAVTQKISLQDFGFGWVESNPVFRFFFTTKIGGGGALVTGACLGLLVEAELDAKKQNAEKIWEEVDRRRRERSGSKPVSKPLKQKSAPSTSPAMSDENKKSKKRSRKGQKRLAALSEVILEEEPVETPQEAEQAEPPKDDAGGIMGKFKEFYDKADSMAASQALILNKELEDRGVVEKITDDTGLKVIGREAASKLDDERAKNEKEETS